MTELIKIETKDGIARTIWYTPQKGVAGISALIGKSKGMAK